MAPGCVLYSLGCVYGMCVRDVFGCVYGMCLDVCRDVFGCVYGMCLDNVCKGCVWMCVWDLFRHA